MQVSLKNYTFRYLVPMLLIVIGIWAFLFYHTIVDEVYDNIDDGLKNQKIEIIREAFVHPDITKLDDFGVNQFQIIEVTTQKYNPLNKLTTDMVFMPYDGEYEPYRVLRTGFKGIDKKNYSLTIRTSMMEEDDMLFNLAISLVVLYLLILASTLVIHQIVIRKALKPFNEILNQIKLYRLDKSIEVVKIKSDVKEFNTLEEEVLEMIERNEDMYHQQKLFIENASHELQTPLTVTINQLELILENGNLPEYEYLKIVDAKNALWRMVHLNKALLILSRINNEQYRITEEVNFTEILEGILNDFGPLIESSNVKLEVLKEAHFIALFNKDMATVLLSNLFRNALKHNSAENILKITSTSKTLVLSNSGIDIPLNPNLIFERFYKSGNAENSNGLGLSIVKSIVERQNQISLKYYFEEGLHQFKIKKKDLKAD